MKPQIDDDNVKGFVEQYYGVDMGDHFFVTWDNMIKLLNGAITKGYTQAMDDHDIIHGESARKFLEDMNKPKEEMTYDDIKRIEQLKEIKKKHLPNLF